MSGTRWQVQGSPFVPGRARGVIRFGPAREAAGSLLVLGHSELGSFETPPAGLVMVAPALFSHPMIRLLGQGIPTIVASPEQAARLPEGAEAILDGNRGRVGAVGVDEIAEAEPKPDIPQAGMPVASADGQKVELRASIADLRGAAHAVEHGATAVGLVRSEYFSLKGGVLPDAAFFVEAFDRVCVRARPLPVTIRLVDVAGDKRPPWLDELSGMTGPLGLQGSRLYATEPVHTVLEAQVSALAGLAPHHPLSLLVPYVDGVEEFRRWRRFVDERSSASLPVGAMAESPAAALSLPELMWAADFVGLGCNDLMQGLFAADRDVPEVGRYLDPYSPALFRFLHHVAVSVGNRVSEVQLCGLLPQLPGTLPVLLGLGYRTFSVEPVLLPHLAATVSRVDTADATALAHRVWAAADSAGVRALLGLSL